VYLENGGGINTIGTSLTTINGRFMVNNMSFTTGGSGLSVGGGGVLGGSGTITGSVAMAANGNLDAGSTPGAVATFTVVGNVTLAEDARLVCDYDGTTNDTVVVNGTVTLPASATVTTVGPAKPTLPFTILTSTNLVALSGVSGWTLTGSLSEEKVLIVGNTVVVTERLRGTVLSCQ
jgi:hypothetical protein